MSHVNANDVEGDRELEVAPAHSLQFASYHEATELCIVLIHNVWTVLQSVC